MSRKRIHTITLDMSHRAVAEDYWGEGGFDVWLCEKSLVDTFPEVFGDGKKDMPKRIRLTAGTLPLPGAKTVSINVGVNGDVWTRPNMAAWEVFPADVASLVHESFGCDDLTLYVTCEVLPDDG